MSQVGQDSEFALALLDITETENFTRPPPNQKENASVYGKDQSFGLFLVVQGNIVVPTKQVWKSSPFKTRRKCTTSGSRCSKTATKYEDTEDMDRILSGEKDDTWRYPF